jgi:hypothetical protein
LKQYVDRPSGEPARRQACRSGVSAVAVEAFVNNAGYGDDRIGPSVANIVSPDRCMLNPELCCAPLKLWTGGLDRWMQETH